VLFVSLLVSNPASAQRDVGAEVEAAIVAGYVDGVHRNQDGDAIRKGLHEQFVMSILRSNSVIHVTRDDWIARIEKSKSKTPADTPSPEITYEFTLLDHTGDAAVAKIDLFRDGEHAFTDYMSLYHFEEGWKIVGKTFHSHN